MNYSTFISCYRYQQNFATCRQRGYSNSVGRRPPVLYLRVLPIFSPSYSSFRFCTYFLHVIQEATFYQIRPKPGISASYNTKIVFWEILLILCIHAVAIGVAGPFSGGLGQAFRPAKIQSFPVNFFSCQGGQVFQLFSAKLLCYATLLNCSANGQKWQVNG